LQFGVILCNSHLYPATSIGMHNPEYLRLYYLEDQDHMKNHGLKINLPAYYCPVGEGEFARVHKLNIGGIFSLTFVRAADD